MENIKTYTVWAPITQFWRYKRLQKIYNRMDWNPTFYAGGDRLLGMIMNTMNNGAEIIMQGNDDSGLEVKSDKTKVYENGMKQAE